MAPRDDDFVDFVVRLGERAFQQRLQRAADNGRLGARMFQHVGVVVRGEQRVDGDRDDSRIDRSEKSDGPVGAVEHQKQHALLALDPARFEGRCEAPRALLKFPVGHCRDLVDEGRLARATSVRREEMVSEVEGLRRRFDAGGCGLGGLDHCMSSR